jgi:hypothetical protein
MPQKRGKLSNGTVSDFPHDGHPFCVKLFQADLVVRRCRSSVIFRNAALTKSRALPWSGFPDTHYFPFAFSPRFTIRPTRLTERAPRPAR